MALQPNWFERRYEFHRRCEKLQKLLSHRPTLYQEDRPIQVGPRSSIFLQPDGKTYKNEVLYKVLTEGKIWVTVKLDDCGLAELEETREFTTEAEAQRCFKTLLEIKHLHPEMVVEELQTFV